MQSSTLVLIHGIGQDRNAWQFLDLGELGGVPGLDRTGELQRITSPLVDRQGMADRVEHPVQPDAERGVLRRLDHPVHPCAGHHLDQQQDRVRPFFRDKYRRAFEHIWWSIVKLDRHNNGGFSSGEQAQGNPYHKGAIETCCTIAWTALSVEMLRLTGNPVVADELELSTLNSVLGLHSRSGRWVTYNTPMDGTRLASAHDIVFQARAGSPVTSGSPGMS